MPRGQKTTTPERMIDINVVKKYLEQGYLTNWGDGYIWNDNKVVLRKFSESNEDDGSKDKHDYVIISKYDVIEIGEATSLKIN